MTDMAVVLAAGRGTRLRRRDADQRLLPAQARAAAAGAKALMPVGPAGAERPLIDFVVAALEAAGTRRICVVVGPQHAAAIRRHFAQHPAAAEIVFARQDTARGTADAVASAAALVGNRPFLVIGCDTWVPPAALAALAGQPSSCVLGFARRRLLAGDTNLDDERLRSFAVLDTAADRQLLAIREKVGRDTWLALEEPVLLSLNAWRFEASIFGACRAVAPSPRGELELPDAVGLLIAAGSPVAVLPTDAPALDLTERRDAARLGPLLALHGAGVPA